MMQWLEQLNQEQRRAVEAGDGPVLIVAGPGTGKTKTLTARIAYLIASGKAQPGEILALTFTKKAAEEMAARVVDLLKVIDRSRAGTEGAPAFLSGSASVESMPFNKSTTPRIATFHALCSELLGDEIPFVAEPVRIQLIKDLPKPAALKGLSSRDLGLLISRYKNMAEDDAALKKLVKAYDTALHEQGLRDFDDLLVQVRELLMNDETKRDAFRQQYRYILVDEFQDTNRLQYELLNLLRGNDNVFVIGDPNQSIYGFRGASGSIFDQFKADFPAHNLVTLTANYRSTPEVVTLANAIFTADAPLQPQTTTAGRVRAVQVLNEYSEANWVMNEIQQAIGGGDMLSAVSDDERMSQRTLRDFAILYRSRAAALTMQKAIEISGLPYQIVGEGSPYEQPQVQALMALLRAATTGEVPQLEGFRSAEIRAVQDMLTQDDSASPTKLAKRLVDILKFELTNSVQQFINTLVRFNEPRQALAYFDSLAETRFYDPIADVITLLTVHAAKGLEFPYVFLIGAEEGILPHSKADAEEERRLFYVAVTRAREKLDIIYGKNRGGNPAEASRFIREPGIHALPHMLDPNLAEDARRAQKRAIKRSQQSLF